LEIGPGAHNTAAGDDESQTPGDQPRPGNPAAEIELDAKTREHAIASALSRLWAERPIQVGALLVLVFQAGYLIIDVRLAHEVASHTLPFHALNLVLAATVLGVGTSAWYREHWKSVIWATCASLLTSTVAITLYDGEVQPLFASVLLFLIGTGVLAPWGRTWQATLDLVGVGCLALVSPRMPIGIYEWMTVAVSIAVAHASHELGIYNRLKISESMREQVDAQVRLQAKVAELERAERRARASEETLRKIIESSPDVISINRFADGKYVNSNAEFVRSGYTVEETVGRTAGEISIFADKRQHREYLRRLNARKSVRNFDISFRRRDGRLIPCLISSVIVDLNGEECVISFVRDNSRREEIERKLRESEASLRRIIETSPDAITIRRLSDDSYVSVNSGFVEATGYQPEEVIGRTPTELGVWADPDHVRTLARRLESDSVVRGTEVGMRDRQGRISPHLISAVLTEVGGEKCIVSFSRDISALKNAERELVAAREAALAAARAKSEFLSSMSHEIRTPLNAIIGMADLVADGTLSEEQRRWVNVMMANGDSLLDLINDILDLAKIESGRLSIEQVDFRLDELIDKLGEMMGIRAHQKGLELAIRIAPEVPLNLIGDPLRLRQILVNLLGNAVKFTERGEVVLTVECDSCSQNPGRLRFSVRDTGIGIVPDKLATVFSAFTQADSSTTRRYGGSGLGLAIVRRLVELYGGEITAESEAGVGSCFRFTADFGVGAPSDADRSYPSANLQGLRVLVVDDTKVNREILGEILAREGALVADASSGEGALAELERAREAGRPYRLMVLDCRMPGMDGIEVVRRLRQLAGLDPTHFPVVVMLTSDELSLQPARLRDLGIHTYLVKPIRRLELLDTIGRALGAASADQRRRGPVTDKSAQTPVAPLRVLLADDSEDNRLLVRAYFRRTSHELDETEDGAAAVEKFKRGRYDVVLMDIRMPVMDGRAATRAIRTWEREHHLDRTPVIALTASALQEEVRSCLDAGCDAHVSKPVKRAALLEAIRAAASTKRPAAESAAPSIPSTESPDRG
jgi:two-component system, sensor histidine kinase and response regulator